MKDFKKLKVWQKAHTFTLNVYKATQQFPSTELYGLVSQVRRSCVSIPANIAEGCGRGSDADFARFLQIAMGSASEVEYYLILSHDLEILTKAEYDRLTSDVTEVKRILTGLIKKLKADR
jgi:four helix bundle protein